MYQWIWGVFSVTRSGVIWKVSSCHVIVIIVCSCQVCILYRYYWICCQVHLLSYSKLLFRRFYVKQIASTKYICYAKRVSNINVKWQIHMSLYFFNNKIDLPPLSRMIIFAVADFNSKPKVLETHLLLSKWVCCGSYPLLHRAGRTYQAKLPTSRAATKTKIRSNPFPLASKSEPG